MAPTTATYIVRNEFAKINGYKKYEIALVYDLRDFAPRTMAYHMLDRGMAVAHREITHLEKLEFENYPLHNTRCHWLKYQSVDELMEDETEMGVCGEYLKELKEKLLESNWIPKHRTKTHQPDLFTQQYD